MEQRERGGITEGNRHQQPPASRPRCAVAGDEHRRRPWAVSQRSPEPPSRPDSSSPPELGFSVAHEHTWSRERERGGITEGNRHQQPPASRPRCAVAGDEHRRRPWAVSQRSPEPPSRPDSSSPPELGFSVAHEHTWSKEREREEASPRGIDTSSHQQASRVVPWPGMGTAGAHGRCRNAALSHRRALTAPRVVS